MKRYWIIIISLLLLAPCVWAQTFKRTTKMPGFFVPKGALQTKSSPERLVPIEAMQYQGQQAPIATQANRQAQENIQKETEQKAFNEKEKVLSETTEKQKLPEPTKLQQQEEQTPKEEVASLQTEETPTEIPTSVAVSKNKTPSAQQAAILKAERIKKNLAKQQAQKEDEEKFAQIIAEYHSDIKAISEGTPVSNQRLIDMIADYKNFEHSI